MPASPMNPAHILNNFLFSLGNFTSVDPDQAVNQIICSSAYRIYHYTINFQSSNFKIIFHELIGFTCHYAKLFPILILVNKVQILYYLKKYNMLEKPIGSIR